MLVQSLVACETVDFDDINANRNGATKPSPAGLLSSAIMSFSNITGRDGLMRPTLAVQYQAQVTYTDEMLYSEAPSSWYTYYINVMAPLDQVIKYNQDEANQGAELNAQGAPNNQIGVAMIFKAIAMKRVTDTWGDAPYSQAFQGLEGISPAYDKQEDIYKTLIEELKAGRDMLDAGNALPTGDILYNGDVTKWKQLANSVLLQMSLQLSKRYPEPSGYAATEFNSALADANGVIDDVAEEAWFRFEDQVGFTNPWNANRTRDYFLTAEFVDAMQGDPKATSYNPTSNTTPDARINVYAKSATLEGVPYGFRNGSGSGKNQVSTKNYWNNTSTLPLMTASYTYLNRADAAAMGWTTEDAKVMLTKGIEASFATLEAHYEVAIADKAAAYAAKRVADATTVGIGQVIAEEKWVSLFGMGFDAWAEWRRTGIPTLKPAADYQNAGQIPRRYLYPVEEATLNGGAYQSGVAGLAPATDNNTARVWWDVE